MPSEFAKFQQAEENVDALLRFLSTSVEDLPKDIPSSWDYLKEDLEEILTDLQTDQGMLRDNINQSFTDDTSRKQRRDLLNSLNKARIILVLKLLPKTRRLYEDLQRQPDTQDLAKNLIAILAPIEEQYRPRRSADTDFGISTQSSLESERFLQNETAEEQVPSSSPIIDRVALKDLTDLQQALNHLVMGYIASRKQLILCETIKAKLQEAMRENPTYIPPHGFWSEINDLIEDAHRSMNKDFPSPLRSDLFDRFISALSKAQQVIESGSATLLRDDDRPGIQPVLIAALDHLDSAIRRVKKITEECEDGAIKQVPLIDQKIKDIFKKEAGPSRSSESSSGPQRTPRAIEQIESARNPIERTERSSKTPI